MKCKHKDYCRSPVACGGFGYCRERNMEYKHPELISKEQIKEWQNEDESPSSAPSTR